MSLVKQLLHTSMAFWPDTRITANAEMPEGVAGATMVSFFRMVRNYMKVRGFECLWVRFFVLR